jgi:hypothetical protein
MDYSSPNDPKFRRSGIEIGAPKRQPLLDALAAHITDFTAASGQRGAATSTAIVVPKRSLAAFLVISLNVMT